MSDFTRPHILIVTDDLGLGQFLQEGLTVAGFWTSTVASALQTLEIFRLRTFDLMLIDVALQGMGAHEVLRRLLSDGDDGPRTDIPVLAVAGNTAEITADLATLVPVGNILLPPLDIEELALRLFAIVREWRADHPGRPWADELAQRRDQ